MTTAYAVAWMNPKTLKIERVSINSEGAMTLTRDSSSVPLDMFRIGGEDFEDAQNNVINEIKNGWFFEWARPLLP